MLKQTLDRNARFNLWANTKIVNTCIQQNKDVLLAENSGSFSSIASTLSHILLAEWIWLERMKGVILKEIVPRDIDIFTQNGFKALLDQSSAISKFVGQASNANLIEPITYFTTQGDPLVNTREEMLSHCINHSSYHRGQVINYLRQNGVKSVPSTDLIHYLRSIEPKP